MEKVKRKDLSNNSQNKKRKFLSIAQKKELCEKHQDQNLNGMQLAREYGISDSTVSDILKKSEHWLSIDTTLPSASNFREKISNYPQIEEAVSIWVDQQISRNLILNGPIICEKAKEFTEEELSLEEIVNIVKGQVAVEDDEAEEVESITTSDALNSIEQLIKYVQQNNLDINNLDMQSLLNLKKKIISDNRKRQRQSRLDDFF